MSVRPLEARDLPAVARLYQRAFRKTSAPPSPALVEAFRELFLGGPFAAPDRPSLVAEAGGGEAGPIVGFIGALTRPFTLRGRRLRGTAATGIMVDPDAKGTGLVALELVGALCAGPQDFSFSDGMFDVVEPVWRRKGGEGIAFYSLEWACVLRPGGHLAFRAGRSERFGPAVARAAPVVGGLAGRLDALLLRAAPARFAAAPGGLDEEEAAPAAYVACLSLPGPEALRPVHEEPAFSWLVAHARTTTALGRLHLRLLRRGGSVAGGYATFVRPGGLASVLHLAAASRAVAPEILRHLLAFAQREGAVAVKGQADERFRRAIEERRGVFTFPGFSFMAQAKDPEILSALHRADTSVSRLDGEWWTRIGIDRRQAW